MYRLFGLMVMVFSLSAYGFDYEIVGANVCSQAGNYFRGCQPQGIVFNTAVLDEVIPAKTTVSVNVSGPCNTAYPIWLQLQYSDGTGDQLNVFGSNDYSRLQDFGSNLSVSVNAPYANFAYFSKSCSISASIDVDQVDIGELTLNLNIEKTQILQDIDIIDDRLDDKSTIASLLQVAGLYEALLGVAENDLLTYAQLNLVLNDWCDVDAANCTWSDQIGVVLNDVTVTIPFNQMMLLFNLGIALDSIVPSDCTVGNCVVSLIDDQTEATINSITSSINTSQLDSELIQLAEDRRVLSDRLITLSGIASDYNIAWDEI